MPDSITYFEILSLVSEISATNQILAVKLAVSYERIITDIKYFETLVRKYFANANVLMEKML